MIHNYNYNQYSYNFNVFGQKRILQQRLLKKAYHDHVTCKKFPSSAKKKIFGLYNPSMCDMAYHHFLTSFVHDHLSKYKLQRWLEMRIRFLFAAKEKLCVCFFDEGSLNHAISYVQNLISQKRRRPLLIFFEQKKGVFLL